MADERGTSPGPARAPQESLLTRFLDLAAQQLGRQSRDTGATSPSTPAGSQSGSVRVSDPSGFDTITFEDWSEYTQVDRVESDVGCAVQDAFERGVGFDAGEVHSKAGVRSRPERDVRCGRSLDVDIENVPPATGG